MPKKIIKKFGGVIEFKQKKVIEKLGEVISRNKSASQCMLIDELNPVITGWGNYFRHVVSKEVFSKIDHTCTVLTV